MTTLKTRTRQTPAVREDIREPNMERGVAIGRDGKPIRRVKVSHDKFHVDPSIVPDGWAYQWKRWTVFNQEDPSYQAELARAGFTPVPAERHSGYFLPPEKTGAIIIDGLMLMERPMALEIEAREEERATANAQVNGSRRQFGFSPVAPGFEGPDRSHNAAVRHNSFARTAYEQVNEPKPKYDIEVD